MVRLSILFLISFSVLLASGQVPVETHERIRSSVESRNYLTAARERADVYELRYHPPRSVRRAVLSAARNLLRIEPGVSP